MSITIDIAEFQGKPTGYSEDYTIEKQLTLDGLTLEEDFIGELTIANSEKGLYVLLNNAKTKASDACQKCLAKVTHEITIPQAERIYLFKAPPAESITDPNDLFTVDFKNQEIVLDEMIRQEIILHFPMISVCSNSCEGICQTCGIDKNLKSCDCLAPSEIEAHRPLSALRDLLK